MEMISVKQEPIDDGYSQALNTTESHRDFREQYTGSKYKKPGGKNKLLKLLFSQDVSPSCYDDTESSTVLSGIGDRNGSGVQVKTEVVDPEYEEPTRNGSSVKIKTEVVDPEYEGIKGTEIENMSASKGKDSKLFSLLTTTPDSYHSNHRAVGSLQTSYKNLSSLLSSPSMNRTENLSYAQRNAEFKANNLANKSSSTLLNMLASPDMTSCGRQGNSHMTQKNQNTGASLNLLMTSANKKLNAFDTTLKAMLEKPVPKNTSNKGLVELLNKGVENNSPLTPKVDTGTSSRTRRTVRNRLDATINMLMNKSETNASQTNETAANAYPINGNVTNAYPIDGNVTNDFSSNWESSSTSDDMQSYNHWIEHMSSFLIKQAVKPGQEMRATEGIVAHNSPKGHIATSHENNSIQRMPYDSEADYEKTMVPNISLDKEGAMFITVNPRPLHLSTKKRGQDKKQIITDEEPGKKKQKKSFEYLKAELLKPNTKKVDTQVSKVMSNVKENCEGGKTELSKRNVNLSSLLQSHPLNKNQNTCTADGDCSARDNSEPPSQQASPSVKETKLANGPSVKQKHEKPVKYESQIRSILQLPTLKVPKGQGQNDSALREQLNTLTPKISSSQGHSESSLRECLSSRRTSLSSSSQGHSESTFNVQGQDKQNVHAVTPKLIDCQGQSESTVPAENNFKTQFPASSIMMQLSESARGQGHAVHSHDEGEVQTEGQEYFANQGLIDPAFVHKPGENPKYWIYKCKQCNKTFRHAGTLKVHERSHSYEREEFKCNICGKVCCAAGYLAIHMRTHFAEKAKENEGVFTCTICRDTFSEKENLLIHLRMHSGEKLFKCEVCDTGFTRKTQLFIHMRIHTGEKPYRCEICGKTFRQSNGLNLHLTTHTDDKPYRCEICSKGFGRKAHYVKHMKKHRGERPFVCTECGKGFTEKFALTMHKKTHNKEKDHICGICNKGFNHAYYLKNHMKFHTGEVGYRCVYCNKTMEFKRELHTHLKGDHPDLYQEHMRKSKKDPLYTKIQGDNSHCSLDRELENDEDSDEEDNENYEMTEFDYESEAETGADNFQTNKDIFKSEVNDINSEHDNESYTETQDMLTEIKQEPVE